MVYQTTTISQLFRAHHKTKKHSLPPFSWHLCHCTTKKNYEIEQLLKSLSPLSMFQQFAVPTIFSRGTTHISMKLWYKQQQRNKDKNISLRLYVICALLWDYAIMRLPQMRLHDRSNLTFYLSTFHMFHVRGTEFHGSQYISWIFTHNSIA